MKKLVLVRHGNTFGPNDRVCWVGARSDLPLVQYGKTQAKAVGNELQNKGIRADKIIAGPLLRTRETAAIIAASLAFDPKDILISHSLREIDYGAWEGLSNEDIREQFGDTEIDAWQKRAIWPNNFGWSPNPEEIRTSWQSLIDEISDGETAIVVSSNGIYKVLAPLFGIPAENSKMATGSYSILECSYSTVRLVSWGKKALSSAQD